MSKESPMSASTADTLIEKSVREMQSTVRTIVAYTEEVYGTTSEPGSASSTWTAEIVKHVSRSQSSVADVKTTCEHRGRKSCRKALVKFDELVTLVTIEKLRHQPCANTIMLDLVDRSDGVVVGATDRVVKARIVHRLRGQQRQQRQQTSAETAGGQRKARVSDLWSSTFRLDVQLAGSQPRDRRKIFTHTRAVKDVTLQDAAVNVACVASVRAI